MDFDKTLNQVGSSKEQLEKIERDYRAAEEALYRNDGTPKFSKQIMGEKRQEAKQEAQAAIAKVANRLEGLKSQAEQWVAEAEAFDPLDSNQLDLERAQLLAPFIREDINSLPMTTIVARGRTMLNANGKIKRGMNEKAFLYSRFLEQRLAQMDEDQESEPGKRQARELLEDIQLGLGGKRVKLLEENAQELNQATMLLEGALQNTRERITGKGPETKSAEYFHHIF